MHKYADLLASIHNYITSQILFGQTRPRGPTLQSQRDRRLTLKVQGLSADGYPLALPPAAYLSNRHGSESWTVTEYTWAWNQRHIQVDTIVRVCIHFQADAIILNTTEQERILRGLDKPTIEQPKIISAPLMVVSGQTLCKLTVPLFSSPTALSQLIRASTLAAMSWLMIPNYVLLGWGEREYTTKIKKTRVCRQCQIGLCPALSQEGTNKQEIILARPLSQADKCLSPVVSISLFLVTIYGRLGSGVVIVDS